MMVKMQFKDLASLQRYLERGDVINKIFRDKGVLEVLRKEMSAAVHKVVYDAYTPQWYERREDDGGLSDKRNMHITKVEVRGNNIVVLFENLTMGQTRYIPIYSHNVDSLHGEFITDTINDGLSNWYVETRRDGRQGEWTKPRPFVEETISNIKANPTPLIEAIKQAYKKAGFVVK